MSGHSKGDEPNAKFTNFMRRLVAVPHSEIKAKLEAEKEAKRASKVSSSRVSGASSKRATQKGSAPDTLPVSSA
jgi:hypothetical protein